MELFGRVSVNHAWDAEEPRMLVAEAKLIPGRIGGCLDVWVDR